MEPIKELRLRISQMESDLVKLRSLLKRLEEENENNGQCLLSEIAQKGDEVRLYDKLWYVIDIDDGIVKLISKDSAGAKSKDYDESNQGFCRRLHKFSKEYVEEISKDKKLLHMEVRACKKEDLDKYLNRKVEWRDCITDKVWCTGYCYWLASPHPSNAGRVWRVSNDGSVYGYGNHTVGVRPVVYLKSDIRIIGKDENGVWILEE